MHLPAHRGNIEEVIAKFAQLTPQERAKRKLESLEALKKTFKKLDHDVNIKDFLDSNAQAVEELSNHSMLLQSQLSDIHKRLSYWSDLDKINDLNHMKAMEESLKGSLSRIQSHKDDLGKQLVSLECINQFQDGTHLPLGMGNEQEAQPMSWFHYRDNQPTMLSEDPNLLPQRDIECSNGTSIPSYSGYFSIGKHVDIDSSTHNGVLSEFSRNSCLDLELWGKYPYRSYNHNLLGDKNFHPVPELNIQEGHLDYHVASFEMPRPSYDNGHHNWASTSGSCALNMFDDQSYGQPPN